MITYNDRPRASRPFLLLFLALALALFVAYALSPGVVLSIFIFAALVSAGIIAVIERDWATLAILVMDIAIFFYLVFFAYSAAGARL
jgi:hypothetical protein